MQYIIAHSFFFVNNLKYLVYFFDLCYNNTKGGDILTDQSHQSENKLIILYVLNQLKRGLTEEQISYIIIKNLQMSYFDIKLYIQELIETDLIRVYSNENKKILTNTDAGRRTLELFENKIPIYICEMLNLYIAQNKDEIFKEVQTLANYKENKPGDYQITLRLVENNMDLINISFNSPTLKQTLLICEKWKIDAEKTYAEIIKLLTK